LTRYILNFSTKISSVAVKFFQPPLFKSLIDKTHLLGYNLYKFRSAKGETIMPQTTFSVRMDSEVKKQLDDFCTQVGMNTTTAFNMFARAVLREKRLPFEVTTEADPFYCENNLAHLRRGIAALNSGKGVEHDIIEGL